MDNNSELIRKPILVPLALALICMLAVSLFSNNLLIRKHLANDVILGVESVKILFDRELAADAKFMAGLLNFIGENEQLQKAWLAQDREELFVKANQIFDNLQTNHLVTHFYFHGLDQVNFLRVHKPARYGDKISRFTLEEAVRRGQTVSGLELGEFGTFALRVVSPWRIDGELVGYIEIGEEIDHVITAMEDTFNIELIVLINKKFLERQKWEEGLEITGKSGRWEQFKHYVVFSQTMGKIPQEIRNNLKLNINKPGPAQFETTINKQRFHGGYFPLNNSHGDEVGFFIVLRDTSAVKAAIFKQSVIQAFVAIFIGMGLFLLFWIYISRFENRLIASRRAVDDEIGQRKIIEAELEKHRDHLEEMVNERSAQLIDSENKFRTIFDNINDGILLVDIEKMEIVIGNKKFCDMSGYQEDDLLALKVSALHPEAEFSYITEQFAQQIRGEIQLAENIPVKREDGTIFYSDINARSFKIGNQKVLLGVFRDISERKHAEEKIRKQNQFLQTVIESLPYPFFVVDVSNYEVLAANSVALPAGGFQGGTTCYSMTHHRNLPCDDNDHTCPLQEVRRTNKSVVVEHQHYDSQGNVNFVQVHGHPVFDDNGILIQMIEYNIDITAQKKFADEKEYLEIRLRQAHKMEAIGTLAGGIAHDFNNILGVVLGYADMVKETLPIDSVAYNDINEVLKAGLKAKELVKQILTFSRQNNSELIPLLPQSIIKEALKFIRATIPTIIEIKADIDPQCGVIVADPTQLHQVIMNLCTNSFHAMEETGGVLEVSLKRVDLQAGSLPHEPEIRPGPYLELMVKDSGTGITANVIDNIFDPYFTTKEVGKGTGMGLAISLGIIKSFGGAIVVKSKIGKGTTIRVFLPVVDKALEHERKKAKEENPVGDEHILFVDDDESLTYMGKTMLEQLGYKVTARTSSLEALEAFRANPARFDCVITDQTMPAMTGVELAGEIIQIRANIPIIICTGFSTAISEVRAKELGIKEFVYKPLAKHDLAKLVRKVLDAS